MGFFLFIFLLILGFILWPVLKIGFKVWDFQRKMRSAYQANSNPNDANSRNRRQSRNHTSQPPHPPRKRRIPADYGEYVAFEELPPMPPQHREPVRFVRQEQISDVEWEEIPNTKH